MEKDITVSGRPKDQKLLQKAVEQAASEFKEKAGFEVQCEVDDQLGDKSCVLSSLGMALFLFSFSKLTLHPHNQQARRSPLARVRVSDHGQQHARRTVAVAAGADAARDPRVALWQEREPEVLLLMRAPPLFVLFSSLCFSPLCEPCLSLCATRSIFQPVDSGEKVAEVAGFGSASKQAGDRVPAAQTPLGEKKGKQKSECSFLRSL